MCFRIGGGYAESGLRSPRSKRRRVGGGSFSATVQGEWCCIRKASEGTVRRADGEVGVMNRWLGSVKVPLWRAEIVT